MKKEKYLSLTLSQRVLSIMLCCIMILTTASTVVLANQEFNDSAKLLINNAEPTDTNIVVTDDTVIDLVYKVNFANGNQKQEVEIPNGLLALNASVSSGSINQYTATVQQNGKTVDVDFDVTASVNQVDNIGLLPTEIATDPSLITPINETLSLSVSCKVDWNNKPSVKIKVGGVTYTLKKPLLRAATEDNKYIEDIIFFSDNSSVNEITESNKLNIDFDDTNNTFSSKANVRYCFNIPNGETLTDKTLTVKLPPQLKDPVVPSEIYDKNNVQISVSLTNSDSGIKVVFTDEFLARNTREGFFEAVTKYIPTDATLDREDITFENITEPKTIYYEPKLIPPAFKKTFTPENGKYKVTLSVRPGNKRPNPDTQEIALTETLDNIKLIEADKVMFNATELIKDDKYAYTENTTGTTGHKLEAKIDMTSLDSFTWYDLVYYASVDSGVFGLGQNEVKLKTSLGAVSYLDTNSESKTDAILTDTMKETTFKTALVSARYDVVANTHLLKWTVEFNTPEINITNPTAFIKYGTGETFLELLNGGQYDGTTYGITYTDNSSTDASMTFTETGSGTGKWGSTAWQPSFSNKRTMTFYTKIKDEFYKENRDGYKFKMDVSLEWYPVGGSGNGITNGMTWADGFQQGISNSLLKKTFASYDAEAGQATWNISLNANKNNLNVVTITDTLSDSQTFVGVTATLNGSPFTDFKVDSTTTANKVVITTNSNVGTSTIDFAIVTKLDDAQEYANSKITIKNGIVATGDSITTAASNVSKEFDNTIIKKEAVDYNIATREVTWKLVINPLSPLGGKSRRMTDATLTDYVYQNAKENNKDVGHKLIDNKCYTAYKTRVRGI